MFSYNQLQIGGVYAAQRGSNSETTRICAFVDPPQLPSDSSQIKFDDRNLHTKCLRGVVGMIRDNECAPEKTKGRCGNEGLTLQDRLPVQIWDRRLTHCFLKW